jgi:hypothetical protein
MRGARPLFDTVIHLRAWDDAAIARLLRERAAAAGVEPSFEQLVGELPSDGDQLDYEEALERAASNYYRLIWDYSSGNPGVALHTWRKLLGVADDGSVRVRLFEAPRIEELEELPDSAVFVLRSLVQLERAEPEAICRATGIAANEVEDALRFGLVRGYFRYAADGYSVNWSWFRVITRFLQRRHLLFAG